jgi:DNA-binding IclR family transcriptional regulator
MVGLVWVVVDSGVWRSPLYVRQLTLSDIATWRQPTSVGHTLRLYIGSSGRRSAAWMRSNAVRAVCTSSSVGGAVAYRATAYTRVSASTDGRSSGHRLANVGL